MHRTRYRLSIAAMIMAASFTAPAAAQSPEPAQPAARMLIKAPRGFDETCKRYQWFCENQAAELSAADFSTADFSTGDFSTGEPNIAGATSFSGVDSLDLAERINDRVNFNVTQLSDPENYGVADYWTLPTNGNGDCEDFVLQKYKLLLDAGIDSRSLSIAIVLDRAGDNHAVLILRHPSGDLVLDSLVSRIRPWNQTGYTFLAMQSSEDKTQWEVVMNQPRDRNVLAER